MTAKCRSGDFRDSDRDGGGAGSAADADVVEPGAGVGGRITVAKLFAELRPEPSEDVSSLAAVGEGRNLSTTLRHRRFLFTDSFLLLWK